METVSMRLGEGSGLAKVVLLAFAVLITASVVAVGTSTYSEKSKQTKIVNEITKPNPEKADLVALGFLNESKLGPTASVSTVLDGITGEYAVTITDSQTGVLTAGTKIAGFSIDESNVAFSNGTTTFSLSPVGGGPTTTTSQGTPSPQYVAINDFVALGSTCNDNPFILQNSLIALSDPLCEFTYSNANQTADVSITTTNDELGVVGVEYYEDGAWRTAKVLYASENRSATINGIAGSSKIRISAIVGGAYAGLKNVTFSVTDPTGKVSSVNYLVTVTEGDPI